LIGENGVVARREGVVLRLARDADWPRVDEITVICYTAIHASYVAMLGEECYERVRHNPELTWEERKTRQNRQLYAEHPEWVWVLEDKGEVFGFITFYLFPQQGYGHIDNNGVHPDYAGQGWGKYMYHFRKLKLASDTYPAGPSERQLVPVVGRRSATLSGSGRVVATGGSAGKL